MESPNNEAAHEAKKEELKIIADRKCENVDEIQNHKEDASHQQNINNLKDEQEQKTEQESESEEDEDVGCNNDFLHKVNSNENRNGIRKKAIAKMN